MKFMTTYTYADGTEIDFGHFDARNDGVLNEDYRLNDFRSLLEAFSDHHSIIIRVCMRQSLSKSDDPTLMTIRAFGNQIGKEYQMGFNILVDFEEKIEEYRTYDTTLQKAGDAIINLFGHLKIIKQAKADVIHEQEAASKARLTLAELIEDI